MAAPHEERTSVAEFGSRGNSTCSGGYPSSPGASVTSTWSRAGVPADRMQAARASAAALAASAVRVGYSAAYRARARGSSNSLESADWTIGTSGSSDTSHLATRGVATAAVRAAAACAAASSPEDACFSPISGDQRSGSPVVATQGDASPSKAESAAACQMQQASETPTPESASGTTTCCGSADATCCPGSFPEQVDEVEEDTTQGVGKELFVSSSVRGEARGECDEDDEEAELESCADAVSQEMASGAPVDMAEESPATLDEAATGEVWDVIVQRTFISVVPRQKVLVHTASAPGRLVACTESGRASSRRRRRSRRRRNGRGRAATRESSARGDKISTAVQAADDEDAHREQDVDAGCRH